jgi:hypothetical protein
MSRQVSQKMATQSSHDLAPFKKGQRHRRPISEKQLAAGWVQVRLPGKGIPRSHTRTADDAGCRRLGDITADQERVGRVTGVAG